MKKILLVMYRKMLAEALRSDLGHDHSIEVRCEHNYDFLEVTADVFAPDLILLEIPESGPWTAEKCLLHVEALKKRDQNLRVMTLVPENNQHMTQVMIDALRNKQIDDYIYFDSSLQYMLAKLKSL